MKKDNEKGTALIVVLVVLVSLSMLGVSSLNTTGYDHKITGNYKAHEVTFSLTDGTLNAVTMLVSKSVQKNAVQTDVIDSGIMTSEEAENFYDQLAGFEDYDSAADVHVSYGSDSSSTVNSKAEVSVNTDVARLGAQALPGSSIKFAMGGSGFNSGTAISYGINAIGQGLLQSQSDIEAVYFKILGP